MKRLPIVLSSLVALAVGWTLGSREPSTAEAKPRASCRTELARARVELKEYDEALRQVRLALEHQLASERERVKILEAHFGQPIRSPLPDAPPPAKLE